MTRILNCRKLLFATFFTLFSQIVVAQLTTNSDVTPEEAVELLTGEGVIISNIEFSGYSTQLGSFNCNDCGLGLENGIVLATGDVVLVEGPNDTASEMVGGVNIGVSDPDLELLENSELNDAAVLEFDFMASSDSVSFEFVFGSEEYPEYVNSINDVFGFFLSGPGIEGPFSNDGINIALIPGTDTPVSISTVNNGEDGTTGPCVNCEFYINNGPDSPSSNSIQFDGFTTIMEADAGGLQCGETYHIKLAIADNLDASYDSGIFLNGNSLSSGNSVDTNIPDFLEDSTLMEGCSSISFPVFNSDINEKDTVFVNLSGSAVNGLDYSGIPDFVVLDSGECSEVVAIEPLSDNISEDTETLFIQLWNPGLGEEVDTLLNTEYQILDYTEPSFVFADSLTPCYEEDFELIADITSGIGYYDFEWNTGDTSSTTVVNLVEEETFTLSMSDACGSVYEDSVTLTPISILTLVTQDMNTLVAVENDLEYQWLDCNNAMEPLEGETEQAFTASENGSYAVRFIKDGCVDISDCYEVTSINIDEEEGLKSLRIFPNPSEGDLIMQSNTQIKGYQLTDLSGRVVSSVRTELNEKRVEVSLPEASGIYFIKAENLKGEIQVWRVVKE